MARQSGDTIQEVKARLNIVEIVRRYVDLKRASGPRWMAPCPFHQETKPSFSVNEEEGFYYCFGCQAAGDVIDFYCRINGLEFKEGLTQLAEEAGVEMSFRKADPKARQERDQKKLFLDMYAEAREHFRRCLASAHGTECREYLSRRGMSAEIVEKFGLGWAPDDWQSLANALQKKGFRLDAAAEAGLLSKNEKERIFDRFRARLIFPIINLSGQVIAFGGRILSSGEPKYINSSDTAIYKKGDHLYGLHQARRAISQTKRALLTEGYVDVLTLHQYGFENGCGVLGTALTSTQVQRLGGFCSDVDLIFDGDGAGRKAALRSAEMILARGINCRVVLLPDGEDVDSLLQAHGPDALNELMRTAPDGLDFCVRTVRETFAPKDVMDWANRFMNGLELPDLIAYYGPRVYRGLGLSEAEVRSAQARSRKSGPAAPDNRKRPAHVDANQRHELAMLGFVVRRPEYLPLLEERGALALLASSRTRGLWEKLRRAGGQDVLPLLDEGEKTWVVRQRMERAAMRGDDQADQDAQREFEEICMFLEQFHSRRQRLGHIEALRRAGAEDGQHDSEQLEILRQLQETLGRKNG